MENVSTLAISTLTVSRLITRFHALLPSCELLNPARHLLLGCTEPIGILEKAPTVATILRTTSSAKATSPSDFDIQGY